MVISIRWVGREARSASEPSLETAAMTPLTHVNGYPLSVASRHGALTGER
ncbi:hypothetical protein [Paraburkholderia kururiensis]|uniref:Uncharacterized protein n=1 Tax=Paraburkholderia kururiensis TaxID=984307 RepID=A0ABZ0WTA6_9BURK|nr:hypothetical protein [Paraburkholderia kururiensis]WQD80633.1 hypothetical protein U0042_13620 [Paraburkholderia kururiensis]